MDEIENKQLGFLNLPKGARLDIMLKKRGLELNCKFQNRELEQRDQETSTFDKMMFCSGSLVLAVSLLAMLLAPIAGDAFGIVAGGATFCSVSLIALGLLIRGRRRRLYSSASALVHRSEPRRMFLKIVGSPIDNAYFLLVKDRGNEVRRWRLGLELGNERLILDHPQLQTGLMAEVYLHPSTGMPLGMFVGESVYWFI